MTLLPPLLALLAASAFTTVARAETRIGIVPVQVATGVPLSREEAESAVRRGVETTGHTVTAADGMTAALKGAPSSPVCRTPGCWTALAAATGSAHLVTGGVARRGAAFRVELRLVDGATGENVATEENQCDAGECALGELVRLSARELVRRTLGRKRAEAVAVAPPSAAPATAPAPPPVDVTTPAVTGGRSPVWTLVAIGAGLTSLTAGAALLAIDGTDANRGGYHSHTTRAYGLAAVGAGLALAGVGTRFFFSERAAGVSVGSRF